MKRFAVAFCRWAFNFEYSLCKKFTSRRKEVLFISRRTNEIPADFLALSSEFEHEGYESVFLVKQLSARSIIPYMYHIAREIYHLARCTFVILDRYDPVVSLINFEYETMGKSAQNGSEKTCDLPLKPVIVQLWHAFGAYKKFGYQSLDTVEGHSRETAEIFNIHRNYSLVFTSGEKCREAFSEAFAIPIDRVVAIPRPEFDTITQKSRWYRGERAINQDEGTAASSVEIMLAPTLRKDKNSPHPFRDLQFNDLEKDLKSSVKSLTKGIDKKPSIKLNWSFHPLEEGLAAPGSLPAKLLNMDCVVTDYSSIVYEAFLLGIPVFFYVPDLDHYRKTPGLNSDPFILCPEICASSQEELVNLLSDFIGHKTTYNWDAFAQFASIAFDGIEHIVNYEHAVSPGNTELRQASDGKGESFIENKNAPVESRSCAQQIVRYLLDFQDEKRY